MYTRNAVGLVCIAVVRKHLGTSVSISMNGQVKISSFFSPKQKRDNSTLADISDQNTPPKKAKLENELHKTEDASCSPIQQKVGQLSPEQSKRLEANKFKALIKLQERQSNGLLTGFGESWFKALEAEFSKTYFVELSKFVASEREKNTIYPPQENVFSFTRACDIEDVKVVILGQDPYHGPKQAHGLSFSVQPGVTAPPSLVNMYQELGTDIEGFKRPKHGYLIGWARQGVLMLNACLTVRAHQANSHKDKGWEKFTDALITWLNKNTQDLVFILWGSYAQKKGARIDRKKHLVLTGVHPSPLSAYRGFYGCKHFSKCNEHLQKLGKKPIDWTELPDN